MSAFLSSTGLVGLQTTLDALRGAYEVIEDEVDDAVGMVAARVEDGAKKRVPVWKADLKDSIETQKTDIAEREVGYFGPISQIGAFQEYGTGPHGSATKESKPPPEYRHGGSHKRPPAEALEDWALDHGFESGHQVAAIIYNNQGVPARPHLFPAMEDQRPGYSDDIRDAIRDALKRVDGTGMLRKAA